MSVSSNRKPFIWILTIVFAIALSAIGASATTLEDIKKRGKLVVATQAGYPPFEFIQDGKIVGYNKDLLDNIVASWGVELEQIDLPFAGILTGLMQKRYDFICTALSINKERASKFAYTMPNAVAKFGILRRKGDTKVKSAYDLSGVVMGAIVPPSGSTRVLVAHNDELAKSGKGADDIRYFQKNTDIVQALLNGQVDAWASNQLTMRERMKLHPDKFEIVELFGDNILYSWITRPEDTELRDAINVEFRRIRDSGEMARLQEKWFGFKMEAPDKDYLPEGAK